jgi:transcriptional regulator with XRE-family HTH domain
MTGEQLRKHRQETGLNSTEFAARLGCTARSLERYESGQRKITPVIERAINNLLDELATGVSQGKDRTKTAPATMLAGGRKASRNK